MSWQVIKEIKGPIPKLNNPILIEGLPGIGNIGKIAADFIIDELKAEKIYTFFSHSLPHSVFINEMNLVELPAIELYAVKRKGKKQDFLFLVGDVQPNTEESCYSFTERVLELCKELGVKEIITIGGIGLASVPKKPKVYCTGNDSKLVEDFCKNTQVKKELYGFVGPIVGVTGLMIGLSRKKGIPGIALLAETIGHPMYIGLRGAKEVIKILSKKLDFEIQLANLNKEISDIENEISMQAEASGLDTNKRMPPGKHPHSEISYIG